MLETKNNDFRNCIEETEWWQNMAKKSKDYLFWCHSNDINQISQATYLFHYAKYQSELALSKVVQKLSPEDFIHALRVVIKKLRNK